MLKELNSMQEKAVNHIEGPMLVLAGAGSGKTKVLTSRIANLIENFDKLCNDVVSGIPAEIEKRQQQYEHYRDSLLSFKEVKTNE